MGASALNKSQVERAKSTINKLSSEECENIEYEMHGFTSVEGSVEYNEKLAKQRILTVVKLMHLACAGKSFKHKVVAEGGQREGSKELNRRVLVITKRSRALTKVVPVNSDSDSVAVAIVPLKKVYKDSIIILPSGGECVIPKELVEQIDKGELANLEIRDLSIEVNAETSFSQTSDGIPIYSGGMFSMSFSGPEGKCLDHPITVYFKVKPPECYGSGEMESFSMNQLGWNAGGDFTISIVDRNGEQYYKIVVKCPGKLNGDMKPDAYIKFKFAVVGASSGIKIGKIRVYNDCKTLNLSGKVYGRNHNKVRIKVPCDWANLKIQYTYEIAGKGQVFYSRPVLLSQLHKGGLLRYCRVQQVDKDKGEDKYKRDYWPVWRGIRKVKFER